MVVQYIFLFFLFFIFTIELLHNQRRIKNNNNFVGFVANLIISKLHNEHFDSNKPSDTVKFSEDFQILGKLGSARCILSRVFRLQFFERVQFYYY